MLEQLGLEPGGYVVATIHREANVYAAAARRGSSTGSPARRAGRLPRAPAHARGARREGSSSAPRDPIAAARLPRPRRARVAGACDRHRLGRAAEGGLLARRPVRHAAAVDGVGRHRRGRRERPRGRRPGRARHGRRGAARCPRSGRSSTATATPRERIAAALCTLRRAHEPGTSRSSAPATSASRSPRCSPTPGRASLLVDVERRARRAAEPRRELHRGRPVRDARRRSSTAGRSRATTDYDELRDADAILIALPTPLSKQREPDLSIVESAAARDRDAAAARASSSCSSRRPTRARRASASQPLLEEQRPQGRRGLPPRLLARARRPGPRGLDDEDVAEGRRRHRPRPARGARPSSTGARSTRSIAVSSPEAAELTKLLENIFRSVNIALVNELAQLCDRMDIDVWEIVDAAATKPFGFMSFKPGPGLGGHCIPIDPFYLTWKAREYDFYTEFIELAGQGQREHAVLLPLADLAGAEPRRAALAAAARRSSCSASPTRRTSPTCASRRR